MKKLKLIVISIILLPLISFSQDEKKTNKGNFYGDVFLNTSYNYDKTQTSFRLNRLHFGYKYQFTDQLYFNGMIEAAREDYEPTGDYNGITNLFEFCLGFKLEKVEGKIGLIGTEFNQQQEKLWQHRYIDKVFADKYGFAPTNDFGAIIIYKPIDIFNIDLAITNGEGHKTSQLDSAFRYAAGISFKPKNGLIARIYGDVVYDFDVQQSNFIGILGYNSEKISIGAEWNQQFNSNNISDYQRSGISAYASYNLTNKYQFFGRFDYFSSNKPNNQTVAWNINNDGKLIIAGFQYMLHKQIKLAIDYRGWNPELNNQLMSYIYFDIELSF